MPEVILPGASGMAPYIYSNDWLTTKDIYKYGAVYCVCWPVCGSTCEATGGSICGPVGDLASGSACPS